MSLTEQDLEIGIVAVNSAKNELRRQSGYSPAQAVFGKHPYVPGLLAPCPNLLTRCAPAMTPMDNPKP